MPRPVDQSQLHRVRLESRDGNLVAVVEIMPFSPPPNIVTWGFRLFVLHSENPDTYREAIAVTSTTPSPGLAEQEVSTWDSGAKKG